MVDIGQRVLVEYRAKLNDGTEFDSTYRSDKPLDVVIGSGKAVAGLEKAVMDMSIGEKKIVHIPAAQAYGKYNDALIETIPVETMPDADKLPIGKYIGVTLPDGPVFIKVLKIEDGLVYLDFNHELAGQDITLEIELVDVAQETAIDREKHPAGCACGCDKVKDALKKDATQKVAAH